MPDLTAEMLIEEAAPSTKLGRIEKWFQANPKAAKVIAAALKDPKGRTKKAIVDVFVRYYPECPTQYPQGIERALERLGY